MRRFCGSGHTCGDESGPQAQIRARNVVDFGVALTTLQPPSGGIVVYLAVRDTWMLQPASFGSSRATCLFPRLP